jgi:hypothetical protein
MGTSWPTCRRKILSAETSIHKIFENVVIREANIWGIVVCLIRVRETI